jgi:hypothetical protein
MKAYIPFISAILLTSLSAGVASAQDSDSADKYHPYLSDNFNVSLGAYRPRKKVTIGLNNGTTVSEELGASDEQSTGALALRWRFTDNWSVWGQYWNTDSSRSAVLEEDAVFTNVTFLKGSTVGWGVDTSILRLFFGRSFFKKPQSEWGLGAGLHWVELTAFLSTDVATVPDIGDINGFRKKTVKGGIPLPNLGGWYTYSWSPKWQTTVRIDWLDIDLGEYAGNMYDVSAGVNYQFSRHVGIGLDFNAFEIQAEVKQDGFNGFIESRQWGPFLSLTANW